MAGFRKLDKPFAGATIFPCEGGNGGIHINLVIGNDGPDYDRMIGRDSGRFLIRQWCWWHIGEIIHVNMWCYL